MGKVKQVDRISYSEGVKINIDDYESRDVHVSYSTDVGAKETVDDAFKRAKKVVRERVLKREKSVRKSVAKSMDFDTMGKIM